VTGKGIRKRQVMTIAKATHERGRFSDKPGEGEVSEESRPERCVTRYLTRVFSGGWGRDRIALVKLWESSWNQNRVIIH
jgi:hypothetical protein